MWLLVARPPIPDAPQWRGRRWLAAVDAVAWPLLLLLVARQALPLGGLVWPVLVMLAILAALSRLHSAVWFNHRYRFSTWRWAKAVGSVLLFGCVASLALLQD
jgi:hypothetical protein